MSGILKEGYGDGAVIDCQSVDFSGSSNNSYSLNSMAPKDDVRMTSRLRTISSSWAAFTFLLLI